MIFLSIYLFERERERAQAGEGQREERENPSSLRTASTEPNVGLQPMTLNRLSCPGAPNQAVILMVQN